MVARSLCRERLKMVRCQVLEAASPPLQKMGCKARPFVSRIYVHYIVPLLKAVYYILLCRWHHILLSSPAAKTRRWLAFPNYLGAILRKTCLNQYDAADMTPIQLTKSMRVFQGALERRGLR